MSLLNDPGFKSKYQKCKNKVKKWETQFKKLHNRNPDKNDIKQAEDAVRHAYKDYYIMKTQMLQDSLQDINLAKDCDDDDYLFNLTYTDNSSMNDSNISVREESSDTKNLAPEDYQKYNNIWGDHLSKIKTSSSAAKDETKPVVRPKPKFNEKMFTGSKLPRSSARFKRNSFGRFTRNLSEGMSNSKPVVPIDDSAQSAFENKISTSQPELGSKFNINQEKFKVIINSTPNHVSLSQSLNITQKIINAQDSNHTITKRRSLNQGWVDRISQFNPTEDSGLGSSLISPTNQKQDTDDEIICASDHEEDEQVKLRRLTRLSYKRKADDEPETPLSYKRLRNDFAKTISSQNASKDVFNFDEPSNSQASTSFSSLRKVNNSPTNKTNRENGSQKLKEIYSKTASPKDPNNMVVDIDKLAEAFIGDESPSQKKSLVSMDDLERKKMNLQDKMESGQANENFRRVNIKKKIFVRGKKSMNYETYKKNKFKELNKVANGRPRSTRASTKKVPGISKCFKCGEAGHWSKYCRGPKGDQLLPVDAVNEDEPELCPYPSLEEAEKMAQAPEHANRLVNINWKPLNINVKDKDIPEEMAESLTSDPSLYTAVGKAPPYYQLNPRDNMIETPEEVFDALRKFGHNSFRPGQEKAVMRILSGRSTLLTLSTGAGKSLCYQLPAWLHAKRSTCITLVISPLVSLMEDQVISGPSFLKSACLHTNQTDKQRRLVMDQARAGKLHILLISPEAVVSGERSTGFGRLLRELPPIAFACIDEAHCISQWSHNFRPSYLVVSKVLREKLGVKTLLGLTATATQKSSISIARQLCVPDGFEQGIIRGSVLPNNLILSVSKDADRDLALIRLLDGHRFSPCASIVIYCTRRDECERLASLLRTHLYDPREGKASATDTMGGRRKGISCNSEAYHAGLSAAKRRKVQQMFMSNKLRVVVATVAFGMGINKSDLRAVIHYNMPSCFEAYVQEVGRAGRDGEPAHCHLFLDPQSADENELRRHIYADSVDRHTIRKLLNQIFKPCRCSDLEPLLHGAHAWTNADFFLEENEEISRPNIYQTEEDTRVACPGHEIAMDIDDIITTLDLPQENIATLLCYLELDPKRLIRVLPTVYTHCTFSSYQGVLGFRQAVARSPPLAMAIAMDEHRGIDHSQSARIEFPIVEVASAIGWSSGQVKAHLKDLEWKKTEDNKWKRTAYMVEFSKLGMRVFAPGNLLNSELDSTIDRLTNRVNEQIHGRLMQLYILCETMERASCNSTEECLDIVDLDKLALLRQSVRGYFSVNDIEKICGSLPSSKPLNNPNVVQSDVRSLVNSNFESQWTGRAVARIFHGIGSPCFPALTWARTAFWRAHLQEDFETLVVSANQIILSMR